MKLLQDLLGELQAKLVSYCSLPADIRLALTIEFKIPPGSLGGP